MLKKQKERIVISYTETFSGRSTFRALPIQRIIIVLRSDQRCVTGSMLQPILIYARLLFCDKSGVDEDELVSSYIKLYLNAAVGLKR